MNVTTKPSTRRRGALLVGAACAAALTGTALGSGGSPTAAAVQSAAAAPAVAAPASPAAAAPAAVVVVHATPSAAVTAAPAAAAGAAAADGHRHGLTTTLHRVSRPGARTVVLDVRVHGRAPAPVDITTGRPVTGPEAAILGTVVDFGDGGTDGSDGGDVECRAGTPRVRTDLRTQLRHTYARPGTYTVRYTVTTCSPTSGATVTRTTTTHVTVRRPRPALRLTLVRSPRSEGRLVVIDARARGTVPAAVDPDTGAALTGPESTVLATTVDLGDGATDGSDGGEVECRAGAPRTSTDFATTLSHRYARPGTYTVTWKVTTCAPGSTGSKTWSTSLDVVVR